MTTQKHISTVYQASLFQMLRRSWQCADIAPDNVVLDEEFMINQTNDPENELYFYHTDLPMAIGMGSSSWITDASGTANQYLAYLPFGESFIDQRATSHDIRFKFTGKERDSETGMDYFGARYYSSVPKAFGMSIWLSVDPLSDKHPDYTPYAYVYNCPTMLIDPFGMDSIFYNSKGAEINRVKCNGDDTYFLRHDDGNKVIRGENYYQGLSKESFFGDRSDKSRQGQVFDYVDDKTIPNFWAAAALADSYTPDDETSLDFVKKSTNYGYYDYKNKVLNTDPRTGKKYDNRKTAYMVNGILMNRNEAGNVLWGAFGAKVGLPLDFLKIGANAFTKYKEGKRDEYGEPVAISRGWQAFYKYLPDKITKRKKE